MGMTSIVFREGCKNINNFSAYLCAEIPLKAQNTRDTLSYLWTQTQTRFNKGTEFVTNLARLWTDAKTTVAEKTEDTKKKFEIIGRETINANIVGTAFSTLAISYFRLDERLFTLVSSLIKPALFLAGATIVIAGNARGSGLSKEEVLQNPFKRFSPFISSCLQYAQQQENSNSRISLLYQQTKTYRSWALTEITHGLRGTVVLFIECGGQPKALLAGIGAAEPILLLQTAGYVDPGFLATTITVGLAAAFAMGTMIYSTPLPESQQKLAPLDDKKAEKEEVEAEDPLPAPIQGSALLEKTGQLDDKGLRKEEA